jgi:hypothetical protein
VRRLLACGLAALLLAGCSSMHATRLSAPAPGGPAPGSPPGHVRVRLTNGSTVWLQHPTVDGDSLRGVVSFGDRPYHPGQGIALALADVRGVETRRVSPGKTVGLILGVGAFWTGFVILLRSFLPDNSD